MRCNGKSGRSAFEWSSKIPCPRGDKDENEVNFVDEGTYIPSKKQYSADIYPGSIREAHG